MFRRSIALKPAGESSRQGWQEALAEEAVRSICHYAAIDTMNIQEHVNYWLDSANNDLGAAEQLFSSGRYDWCLFIGHLVTEKTLKAFFVYKNDSKIPPKTHNLLKLAQASDLPLTEDQEIFLDEVNDFNLEVRYPEYRSEFYKLCTREFAESYFARIKEFVSWLTSQITFDESLDNT